MAITFEKIQAGMTLYYRFRQRMGNTTARTIVQGALTVLEVDAVGRRFKVRRSDGGETWHGARLASRYFSWSMYDKTAAEITQNFIGQITKVTKKKAAKG